MSADPAGEEVSLPSHRPTCVETWLETLSVIAVGALCLTISTAVLTRALWRSIVPDEVQWVQLMMVVIILAPLAVTFVIRMTIEVEVFTNRAGPVMQRYLAVLGHLCGSVFLTFLTWAGWRQFMSAWTTGEYYKGVVDIPNWIGTGLFTLCLAVALMRLMALVWLDLKPRKA